MKTSTITHKTNGVDVRRLFETIDAIKATPKLAKFRFRARNEWIDCGHNRSTIHQFYGCCAEDTTRTEPWILDADEPPVLLGEDKGPNPVEHLLHALAACLTTAMVFHAAARGIELEGVESRLEGDIDLQGFLGLDPNVRRGYETIRVTFMIHGNVSDAQIEELCAMAMKHSPVFDCVSNPVPVTVRGERAA